MDLYKKITIYDSKVFYGTVWYHKLTRNKADGKLYWTYDEYWIIANETPPGYTDLDPKGRNVITDDIPFMEGDL